MCLRDHRHYSRSIDMERLGKSTSNENKGDEGSLHISMLRAQERGRRMLE
jgi:hypothetical protein